VKRFTGTFTLISLQPDGSGWVTADPLGTAMIYRAEAPSHSVLTNRASLAAALVTPPDTRAARDLEAMATLAFTGSCHGGLTGYQAVNVLPQASIAHIAPGRPPRVETWSELPWWADHAGVDHQTVLVERGLDRLGASVRLMVESSESRAVCELTGGKDSRLVLALLLDQGLARDVEFQTWGEAGLPDVEVASMLTERYGLDHRVGSAGMVDRTGRSGRHAARSSNWRTRPLDLEERHRHHVWMTSGLLTLWVAREVGDRALPRPSNGPQQPQTRRDAPGPAAPGGAGPLL